MNFREFILLEGKQDIINLGYPEIIAKLFYERFGKNTFLIAKWFREYKYRGSFEEAGATDWWRQVTGSFRETPSLYDLTYLYESTDSVENYKNALDKLELSRDEDWAYEEDYLREQREALRNDIKDKLLSEGFFKYYDIIKDIENKTLVNIAPYKKLRFIEAQHKYDEKKIFEEKTPLKIYKNGFKWIDVGKKCNLIGHLMKNCGSAGVMSLDKNRTMMALFSRDNKPHVVVTYSPNEKRISGDEGVASSEVKSKYHSYILDLSKTLNAEFDAEKSASKLLKMKYLFQDAGKIEKLKYKGIFDEYFKIVVQGKEYYSNGYSMVSKEDLNKLEQAINQGSIKLRNNQRNIVKTMFNSYNKDDISHQLGVKYIRVNRFEVLKAFGQR